MSDFMGSINETKMVNGHPVSEKDGMKFSDLSDLCQRYTYPQKVEYICAKRIVIDWISENVFHSIYVKNIENSYHLKHLLEQDTGIYMTNDQFKDIMYMMGFSPLNMHVQNWDFNVTLRHEEAHDNFFIWGCKFLNTIKRENDIKMHDFLYDMKDDDIFPNKKFQSDKEEFMVILAYLFYDDTTGGIPFAIEGFLNAWKYYIERNNKTGEPSTLFNDLYLPIYQEVFERGFYEDDEE